MDQGPVMSREPKLDLPGKRKARDPVLERAWRAGA